MNAPAQTVAQAFGDSAQRFGAQPFLCVLQETARHYGIAAGETSYREAAQRVAQLRAAYAGAGYGHGHRVALLLENRPAFFLHWFALNSLGVSVVPVHADLRAAELGYLIAHSEVVLAVALESHQRMLLDAAEATGRRLAVVSGDGAPPPAPTAPPLAHRPADLGSECALLYTSGTTGRPKGCILPNRYFLHAGEWYAAIGGMAQLRIGEERLLTPLPLTHMNAMAFSTMAMVATGGCLIPLDRFHPRSWWDAVRESRSSVVHYLGVMPAMLMRAPPSPADREHEVRFGFGAGVDASLHAPFEARFGFPLLEAWAMTETGAGAVVIANREPRQVGSHCFGREGSDVEVRLIADCGATAGTGEPGELLVRHAGADPRDGFFGGYLKDESATAEAWDEGWFHTGDIVRRDTEGQLHFVDRRKNVIRRSGENISAADVEGVLLQHPGVRAAAVAATPDPVRGDEVLACIVSDAPAADPAARRAVAADIVDWCLARLAYHKAPGWVAFVDSLPLTPSQKVQRGELRALAAALPGRPECIDTRAMKRRPG